MKYELLYIIPAKYTDAEVTALVEKISGIVTAAGGTIAETHNLGKRKLAYPINGVRNGDYILSYFESETEVASKLNLTLRLSTDIVRHLIVERDLHLKGVPTFTEDEPPMRNSEDPRMPRPEAPRVQQPMPVREKAQISMEEIDKKLDAMLTDEVK
jgi:small subunit ribosomal protein S6